MKYFMLLGGFTGFVLTFGASLLSLNEPGSALLNAGIGCIVGALLMRGFRHVFNHCARQVLATKSHHQSSNESAPQTN